MRKRAAKIAVFLLIGAIVNLVVALSLDWHANTAAQSMSLVRPDDATIRGWIGRFPDDAIAAWGWEGAGVSSVAALLVESDAPFEFDFSSNLIRFPYSTQSPPVRESALVLESRAGWPFRAFVGRIVSERSPRLAAMALAGSPRATVAMSLHLTGRPQNFDLTTDMAKVVLDARPERLDLSGFAKLQSNSARVDLSGLAIDPGRDVMPEDSNDEDATSFDVEQDGSRDRTPPLLGPGPMTVRDKVAHVPANEDIQMTGHTGVGFNEVRPIPAAANGRWNVQSIVQNFDTGHRVWPLPYRPTWPGFAVNTLLYGAIAWLIFVGPFALRRFARSRRGLCVRCAYDLRGADHERCPECGTQTASRHA